MIGAKEEYKELKVLYNSHHSHTLMAEAAMHAANLLIRTHLGFSIRSQEIKPATFWSLDEPLYLLSHRCHRTFTKEIRVWILRDANIVIDDCLKVPYYTIFHQFHRAVRGPTALYLICIAPNPSVVLNFSCLKVALQSSIQSSLFLCLHL